MKKKSWIKSGLAFILAVALVMGVVPMPHVTEVAKAETQIRNLSGFGERKEDEAGKHYYELAGSNTEYALYEDLVLDGYLLITDFTTIDLNGHILTAPNESVAIKIIGTGGNLGTLTLKDRSEDHDGYLKGGNTSGGVYIEGGALTMESGTITECKASFGAGVCAAEGSNFTMTGGTITGNTAERNGGGVYYNGEPDQFCISGSANISGNHVGTGEDAINNNVYLAENNIIKVTDELTSGSGIHVANTGVIAEGYGHDITTGDADSFYCDLSGYACKLDDGKVKFGKQFTMTISRPAQGSLTAMVGETTKYSGDQVFCGDTVTLTALPDRCYQLDTLTVAKDGGGTVELSGTGNTRTFTMPDKNVTVSATFTRQIPVSYFDEKGTEKSCTAYTVLTGGGATELSGGWYVVPANTTVSYTDTVTLGDVVNNIILCDGATLNIGTDTESGRIDGNCISGRVYSLYLYGQSSGTGKLNAYNKSANPTICVDDLTINGGIVTVDSSDSKAILFENSAKLTVNGGSFTATSANDYAIDGDVDFNGGNFIAKTTNSKAANRGISGTISLDYTSPEDTFFASCWADNNMTIADGKMFTEGYNTFVGVNNNGWGMEMCPGVCVKKTTPDGGGMDQEQYIWKLKDLTSETKAIVKVWKNAMGWLPSITVTKASGGTIDQDLITRTGPASDGMTYTFEFPMPSENVTVTADFTMAPITGICGDPDVNGGKNVTYKLTDEDGDGTYDKLVISGTGAMADYATIDNTPPWYANYYYTIKTLEIGEGVTHIGNYAFRGFEEITSVTIPASVGSIGDYAFSECDNGAFTSVTIPESVTSIGDSAFEKCTSLGTIKILGKVTTVGTKAFYTNNNNTTVYARATDATAALVEACRRSGEPNYPSVLNCICAAPTAPEVTLTYNGEEQTWPLAAPTNCGYTVSGNKQTDVGTSAYTATATLNEKWINSDIGHQVQYVWGDVSDPTTWTTATDTAAKEYSWNIAPKSISGVTVSDIADQEYTGSVIIPTVTVKDGTKLLTKDRDYTFTDPNNTTPGTYQITITGCGNYSSETSKTVSYSIIRKCVTITGFTVDDKVYDGTKAATIKGTGVLVDESGTPVDDASVQVDSSNAMAAFENANVGTEKTVMFDGFSLSGSNADCYTLTAQPARVKANITKADHDPETITGGARAGSSGWIDLSPVLVAGFMTLTASAPESASIVSDVSIDGTKLLFTLKSEGVRLGDTGTAVVTVSSGNYKNYTITATVTVTEKDVPLLTADPISFTYTGQVVPDTAITGTAKVGETDVAGAWSFKSGQALTNVADSGTKTVVFAPTDDSVYVSVETTLTLTINKADVSGAPTFTKISASGKTLADAALAIGTLSPTGGVPVWNDPLTTVVTQGTAYGWTYTPADAANYNVKTGSIVLWERPAGGGPDPVPTKAPTAAPVPTKAPTAAPVPTKAPTAAPIPTKAPNPAPTTAPTAAPNPAPTTAPTSVPAPTTAPTAAPAPTTAPTAAPVPTTAPTAAPDKTPMPPAPTVDDTINPVTVPSAAPVGEPTTTTETGKDGIEIETKTTTYTDGSTMTEEKTTKPDGTVTEKTEVVSPDGSKASYEVTVENNGTKIEKAETVSADGSEITSKEVVTEASGAKTITESSEKTEGALKKTEETVQTVDANGKVTETVQKTTEENTETGKKTEKETVWDETGEVATTKTVETEKVGKKTVVDTVIENKDGSSLVSTVSTTDKGKETSRILETSPAGNTTLIEQVKQPSGDYFKVTRNTTVKRDENGNITSTTVTIDAEQKIGNTTQKESFVLLKKSVALKKVTTNVDRTSSWKSASGNSPHTNARAAKPSSPGNRTITIDKTVKSDGKTYTVTTLKKGLLKGNKKAPKKIVIKATGLTKIEKNAFKGIYKKATITVKASKKQFKKLKKMIVKSGIPKKVKIKQA